MAGIGEYPSGYNAKVHGAYNPGRYYGKPDVAFSEVKLGEMSNWLSRRSFSPVSMAQGVSRGYWRWAQKWLLVRKPSFAPIAQFCMGMSFIYYVGGYNFAKYHRHTKYH